MKQKLWRLMKLDYLEGIGGVYTGVFDKTSQRLARNKPCLVRWVPLAAWKVFLRFPFPFAGRCRSLRSAVGMVYVPVARRAENTRPRKLLTVWYGPVTGSLQSYIIVVSTSSTKCRTADYYRPPNQHPSGHHCITSQTFSHAHTHTHTQSHKQQQHSRHFDFSVLCCHWWLVWQKN